MLSLFIQVSAGSISVNQTENDVSNNTIKEPETQVIEPSKFNKM